MDDLPKIYLTDEQHAFQMAAWRDACDAIAQVNARRDSWLEHSVALEKGILAKLAAPPSDKERLWQAAVAALSGLTSETSECGVWPEDQYASEAFEIAEAMVAELNRRTEGGE